MRVEAVALALAMLWAAGLMAQHTFGGLIHLPMVAAIAMLCVRFVQKP